jgi:phosphatidate phosphatase APP1
MVGFITLGNFSGTFATGKVILIEPNGFSIISDIDDTIKESDVHLGKRAAIKAAFFADTPPVPGMADLYNVFRSKFAGIHYVSASPYQLLPTIHRFLEKHDFPVGSLHLRDVWESGNMSSRTYKRSVISQILKVCNP